MDGTGQHAIDFYLRIRHHPVEDDAHLPIAPTFGHPEIPPVEPPLIAGLRSLLQIIAPKGVRAEALQFPARRHFNLTPPPTLLTGRAEEVPLRVTTVAIAREVKPLRGLRPNAESRRERGNENDSPNYYSISHFLIFSFSHFLHFIFCKFKEKNLQPKGLLSAI